jgi:hypothetical protein
MTRPVLSYESPEPPPPRVNPPLRSGWAILACVWGVLANPWVVASVTPPAAGVMRMFIPPVLGLLLTVLATVHVRTSRGERRGLGLAVIAYSLNLFWLLLTVLIVAMLSQWRGD